MIKKWLILFINIFILFSLSGCFEKRDINQLDIAAAIGIDKTENGFLVTVQVVNSPSVIMQSGNRPSAIIYSKEGKTIFEALRRITYEVPNRIFIGHFVLLAFGEEVARTGILQPLLFFYNDHEAGHKFNIIVVKNDTAHNLLKIQTSLNKIPSLEINQSIESSYKFYGTARQVYIDELLHQIKSEQIQPTLTAIEIKNEPEKGSDNKSVETVDPKVRVIINSLAVFKNDKLVDYLTPDETIGFNYIISNIKSTIEDVTFEDDLVSFEVFNNKTKIKLKLENNKPKMLITVKLDGDIVTTKKGKVYLSDKNIKEIKANAEKNVKEKIEKCLTKVQKEYNSDIFGFSEIMNRSKPKYWKSIKENYNEVFKEIEVEVKVEVQIVRKVY